VIAETLRASLPPLLEDVPIAFRADLAALETLPTAALWQQMHAKLPLDRQNRYDVLLEANTACTLSAIGRQELAALRAEADRLMFRKVYAALLLKWRGECIPTLTEFETEPCARLNARER
jgi:hypothetical protein